jgi:hypothetical protein
MQYVLAGALAEHDKKTTGLKQSHGLYEREAARLLEIYTGDLLWASALSEDGTVFGEEDPEDAQLESANKQYPPVSSCIHM